MKKSYLTIFFSCFIIRTISAQDFTLFQPDVLKIKNEIKEDPYTEAFYAYFNNNFKKVSSKYEIEHYEWDNSIICSFIQDFEHGIKYEIWQCKEAGGTSIEITIPKVNREQLKEWIETLNSIENYAVEPNIWKKNDTKYEPKEIVPGCYYGIKEKENQYIIEAYCGC